MIMYQSLHVLAAVHCVRYVIYSVKHILRISSGSVCMFTLYVIDFNFYPCGHEKIEARGSKYTKCLANSVSALFIVVLFVRALLSSRPQSRSRQQFTIK